jgi:hypothetical protein
LKLKTKQHKIKQIILKILIHKKIQVLVLSKLESAFAIVLIKMFIKFQFNYIGTLLLPMKGCLALMVCSSKGCFTCQHFLWQGTSIYEIISEDSWFSLLNVKCLAKKHYYTYLNVLDLTLPGFELTNFRLRGLWIVPPPW